MKLFWGETDYNLILEKILDSKYFSTNCKSLLSSMIYKIDTSYDDYEKVKNIQKSKNQFLEELLENIKKYCDNLKLIEPDSADAKILKENHVLALTNEKERSMILYPTETAMLYGISDVIPKYFYIPDTFPYKNAMQQLLVNGYNENNLEILSDFNGWSWDINLKLKNNLQDNLIYQNLLIVFGVNFLEDWMNRADTKSSYLEKIKRKFKNTKYFDTLSEYLLGLLSPQEKEKNEKQLADKMKELESISDKPKYFETIKKSKMRYLKEVEKIDILLNNKNLLRKEYMAKNRQLDEKKRIPTVGTYRKMIEQRREKCINKISQFSKALNPINYMNHKRELEDFIQLNSNYLANKDTVIKRLQIEFLKAMNDMIFETDDSEKLIDFLIKLRYYRFLYVNSKKQIKNITEIENEVKVLQKKIIEKLCLQDKLRKIAKDEEINSKIIIKILDSKVMDLKDLKFELILTNEKIKVISYEKEVYDKDFELDNNFLKKDFEVKFGKSYRLFI